MTAKPLVSLVVPVYNEASTITANLAVILNAASADDWYELELVAVDDGSVDASAERLERAAIDDPRIRPISFTRNFGKEAAVLAGLREARGDAVIVIDSDLQHPPALIPQMLALWRNGVYVVDAVKASRGKESWVQTLGAKAFYGLFQRFANLNLRGHSDFKLLDRVVVDAYLALPERRHFFRGIVNWANYPSAQLPFTVAERAGGETSWNKLKLARYAIDNLTSFSSMPLRCISWFGAITLTIGLIVGVAALVQKLRGVGGEGFTTVILLIIIMGGAIMLSLGVIGHYIARLYDEIKARPVYLVKPVRKPRE